MSTAVIPQRAPRRDDCRRFPTFRLKTLAGYNDDPVVDDSLQFNLPPFSQYNGWFLKERYLAWSPNSKNRAFLSGIPPVAYATECSDNHRQRRVDGSLGRFDWSYVPQTISRRFWRALCLRPKVGYQFRNDFPEYEFLTTQWESDDHNHGHVKEEFITRLRIRLASLEVDTAELGDIRGLYVTFWNDRPLEPTSTAINSLALLTQWAEAVDLNASIQRSLKDKAAWLLCARRLKQNGWNEALDRVQKDGIPPANNDFIGTWINGNSRNDALWLLSQSVPCFIAHRMDHEDNTYIPLRADKGNHEWWKNTDAQYFDASLYPYDFIAFRNGTNESVLLPTLYPPPTPTCSLEHHRASFPVNQGWRGSIIGYSDSPPPPSPPRSPTPEPILDPVKDSPLTDPRTDRISLHCVDLYEDRIAWVKPPALFDNRGPGKWEKWVTDDWVTCVQVGTKNRSAIEDYSSCLYDRDNRREIYFDDDSMPALPKGYVSDENVYGKPAPNTLFNGLGGRVRASKWLYPSRYPEASDLKAPIPIPPAAALPSRVTLTSPSIDEFLAGIKDSMDVDPPPSQVAQVGVDDAAPPPRPLTTSLPIVETPTGDDGDMDVDPPPSQEAQEGADDRLEEVSLGSSGGNPADFSTSIFAPSIISTFLRSSWFPASVSWEIVKSYILRLTEPDPDVHILRLIVTSTQAATSGDRRQTLWVSVSTTDGAEKLRRLFTGPPGGGPPRDLLLASKEEFDRASDNAVASWSPAIASSPLTGSMATSPGPHQSRVPSPLRPLSPKPRLGSLSRDSRVSRSPTPPPPHRDLRNKGKARADHLPSSHEWWSNTLRRDSTRRTRSPSPPPSPRYWRRDDRHWSPPRERYPRRDNRSPLPEQPERIATSNPTQPPPFLLPGTPEFTAYVNQLVVAAVVSATQATAESAAPAISPAAPTTVPTTRTAGPSFFAAPVAPAPLPPAPPSASASRGEPSASTSRGRPLASRLTAPRPRRRLVNRLSNPLPLADRMHDNQPDSAQASTSSAAASSSGTSAMSTPLGSHSSLSLDPDHDDEDDGDDGDHHTVGNDSTHQVQRRRKNRRRADGSRHRAGKPKTHRQLRDLIEDGLYEDRGYKWS